MENHKTKGTLRIKLHGAWIDFWLTDEERQVEANPHHNMWDDINKYFRKRGFTVKADPETLKNYKSLSKDRRHGVKKDLHFWAERFGSGFHYEFYQEVNVENSNGGRYDFNKYQRMPYMVKLSYRNEAMRLAKYCESIGMNVRIETPMTDIEHIIDSNNTNLHVHGARIEKLDDLKALMEDYRQDYNILDKNKKQIICGDRKCFYDGNGRIAIGTAYHHINSMWWMVVNGKSHNISAGDLFDFYPEVPKREPLTKNEKIQRLHSELKKAEGKMNYERCIVLRKLLESHKLYHVWSLKWNKWWGPNNCGYTSDKSRAGVYSQELITQKADYYNDGENTVAKPVM